MTPVSASPVFTGIEPPAHFSLGTTPARRNSPLNDLLARLADQVLPAEPQFEHFAADAAAHGAANLYDSHEAEGVPIDACQFAALLPLVGAGDRVLFDRRHWREVETRHRAGDGPNGPATKIVKVESTERLRVAVIGLSGKPGELFAHLRVTIEGDYHS